VREVRSRDERGLSALTTHSPHGRVAHATDTDQFERAEAATNPKFVLHYNLNPRFSVL
jgi:hypothetical protein